MPYEFTILQMPELRHRLLKLWPPRPSPVATLMDAPDELGMAIQIIQTGTGAGMLLFQGVPAPDFAGAIVNCRFSKVSGRYLAQI